MSAELYAVTMPKWGLAMTEGKLTSWLAEVGSDISAGDPLLEIETSKIANEFEAPTSGTLLRHIVAEGETVVVGDILGVVGPAGTDDSVIDAFVEQFRATFVPPEKTDDADSGPDYKSVTVGDLTLRYVQLGDGSATPLVLIHGFGGDLNNWMFNQATLAEKRAVYALDLPGHGGSTKTLAAGSIAYQAEVVASFLEALSLPKAHVAGHSMGGAICLELALTHPSKVASLTLICSAGLGAEINTTYTDGFRLAEKRKELKTALELLFANPALVTREMVDDVLKYKRLDGVAQALSVIASSCFVDGKQRTIFADQLSKITAPIQAIWGEADAIIPAAHAHKVANNRIYAAAGHMVHLEASTEVNAQIDAFLLGTGS